MALRRCLRSLVVRESLRPVVVGLLIGLPAAFGLARLLRGSLYGVEAAHPLTYAAVAAALLGVAALAAWFPALSASRVDPAITLRGE